MTQWHSRLNQAGLLSAW